MRVDFYQLGREPVPIAVELLARKVVAAGERLLVVGETENLLETIGKALWESSRDGFLANGMAGGAHDQRQPILLSRDLEATNGAQVLLLADGVWRDPGTVFSRVLFLFGEATIAQAREAWKALGEAEGVERKFWKQEKGRWVEGP